MKKPILLRQAFAAAVVQVANLALAVIVDDGPWTDYDFDLLHEDAADTIFSIVNGIVYYEDLDWVQRVESAQIQHLDPNESIYSRDNVVLVNMIFTEEMSAELFSEAHSQFLYDKFLTAIAYYPMFCAEYVYSESNPNLQSQEVACKRELATFMAHIIYESGEAISQDKASFHTGLKKRKESGCPAASCSYKDIISQFAPNFTARESEQYYGRGASQLRWNSNYGRFSRAWYHEEFNGENVLLDNPNRILDGDLLFFSSALWHYMTPSDKTSAHQLITGFYIPDENQKQYGVGSNFGSTIDVMSQTLEPQTPSYECGQPHTETPSASLRGEIYLYLLSYFNLEPEGGIGCLLQSNGHSVDGPAFWDLDSDNVFTCKLVNYPTMFTIYNSEDYKRCVCQNFGDGEADCPQMQKSTCNWRRKPHELVEQEISIDQEKMQFKIETDKIDLELSDCSTDEIDFYAIELIRDNEQKIRSNPEFRAKYKNLNDSVLTDDNTFQLEEMYIATSLGQHTVALNVDLPELELTIVKAEHTGEWLFSITPCIDRTEQEYGGFDCAPTSGQLKLIIIDLCKGPDSSINKECQKDTPGPDESDDSDDPVDPVDPIDPDPETEDQDSEDDIDQTTGDSQQEENSEENEDTVIEQPQNEGEIDDPDPYNTAPIILDFDAKSMTEVRQNGRVKLDFGELIFDADESDVIQVRANIPNQLKPWVKFNSDDSVIELRPSLSTKPGLWRGTKLIVSDGKEETTYVLNFWVVKAKDNDEEGDESSGGEASTESEDSELSDEETEIEVETSDDDNESQSDAETASNIQESEENDITTDQTDDEASDSSLEEFEIDLFDFQESEFDPATLLAMKELQLRIQKRKEQVLPEIIDERELKPAPKVIIKEVNGIGQVQLLFSEPMQLEEVLNFQRQTSKERRLQAEDQTEDQAEDQRIDLSRLIYAYIQRGDDYSSAQRKNLEFKAFLTDFSDRSIDLKLEFASPLSVSIGDKPDSLILAFRAAELFLGKESNKPLETSTQIQVAIPKQFPSEKEYEIAIVTGSTVQVATNTAFLSQFGATIILAVSLKTMWNLMHTMQLVAYFRLLVNWPANSAMILKSMYQAITLEDLINQAYDSVLVDQFNELVLTKDEESKASKLKANDISYDNFMLSLGIFGIFLVILMTILLFYFMLKVLALRYTCCTNLQSKLRAKLFYSVWIRYMIESYLKMTHSCIFYLFISATFASDEDTTKGVARIAILTLFFIWPFFVTGFLLNKRPELNKLDFKQKFISMYSGLKTQQVLPLIYTMVFCLRRLLVVLALLALQDQGIWLILSFHALQSFYFLYIVHAAPHEGEIDNNLEYFNELCLIAMQYTMIFFVPSGSIVEPEVQWQVGTASMVLLAFLFAVNFGTLIYLTVIKIIRFFRIRKAKEIRNRAVQKSKNKRKVQQTQESARKFNDAKQTDAIMDDFSQSDIPDRIPINLLSSDQNDELVVEDLEEANGLQLLPSFYSFQQQSFDLKIPVPKLTLPNKPMIREKSQIVTSSRKNLEKGTGSMFEIMETDEFHHPGQVRHQTIITGAPDRFYRDLSRCETNIDYIGSEVKTFADAGQAAGSSRQGKSRLSINQMLGVSFGDSHNKDQQQVLDDVEEEENIRIQFRGLYSPEPDRDTIMQTPVCREYTVDTIDYDEESRKKTDTKVAKSVERIVENSANRKMLFGSAKKPPRVLSNYNTAALSFFFKKSSKVQPMATEELPSLTPSAMPSERHTVRTKSLLLPETDSAHNLASAPKQRTERNSQQPLNSYEKSGQNELRHFTNFYHQDHDEAADAFYVSPKHSNERQWDKAQRNVDSHIFSSNQKDLIRGIPPLPTFNNPLELPASLRILEDENSEASNAASEDRSRMFVNLQANNEQAPRRVSVDTQRGGKRSLEDMD